VNGYGGNGGPGRIRISVDFAHCTLAGQFFLTSMQTPTCATATGPLVVYVDRFPN
jgi:hypothetical protein